MVLVLMLIDGLTLTEFGILVVVACLVSTPSWGTHIGICLVDDDSPRSLSRLVALKKGDKGPKSMDRLLLASWNERSGSRARDVGRVPSTIMDNYNLAIAGLVPITRSWRSTGHWQECRGQHCRLEAGEPHSGGLVDLRLIGETAEEKKQFLVFGKEGEKGDKVGGKENWNT